MASSHTEIIQHKVPSGVKPDRLDRYLTAILPAFSRSKIQKLIMDGKVSLRGRPLRKPSCFITEGQEWTIEVPPPEESTLKAEKIPLTIIHEDDWIIVIDKPAGLVVHPGAGHSSGTLANALLGHTAQLSKMGGPLKMGLVHRLDKDTSGIMVIAKNDETHAKLSHQFAGRSVRRVYLALVKGHVQRDNGTIDAPIGRDPGNRKQMAVRYSENSREAITRYKVLERLPGATYLELRPQTGRTHQLRVHLAEIGHPILGDVAYGVTAGLRRQALHAHRLGFEHPGIQQYTEFVSPFPRDLQQELTRLRSRK